MTALCVSAFPADAFGETSGASRGSADHPKNVIMEEGMGRKKQTEEQAPDATPIDVEVRKCCTCGKGEPRDVEGEPRIYCPETEMNMGSDEYCIPSEEGKANGEGWCPANVSVEEPSADDATEQDTDTASQVVKTCGNCAYRFGPDGEQNDCGIGNLESEFDPNKPGCADWELEEGENTCATCMNHRPVDGSDTFVFCRIMDEERTAGAHCGDWTPIVEFEEQGKSEDGMDRPSTQECIQESSTKQGAIADGHTEKKSVTDYLKYVFTREEKEGFAGELARSLGDLEQLKLRKKEVIKSIGSEIATLESTVGRLVSFVRDGYEWRNIDCEVVLNYSTRIKTTIRLDTLETVKTAPMTADELQRVFDFK